METDADTGRTPCEDEGRDQGDVSTSQGTISSWGRDTEQILPYSLENEPTLLTPWFRLLASRTVRQYISVLKALSL